MKVRKTKQTKQTKTTASPNHEKWLLGTAELEVVNDYRYKNVL